MAKTEVYSWRLDPELKQELEAAARAEKTSVGGLLERATKDLLKKRRKSFDSSDHARRRADFLKLIDDCAIEGDGISATNEQVHKTVVDNLEAKYGKRRPR